MCKKLEIGLQTYFDELFLMSRHYGQEEDLYPWIYIILQIVEQKKRDTKGENYTEISIRDVHNAKRAKKKETNREIIVHKGTPDFVIFNINPGNFDATSFLGCVEVKGIHEKLTVTREGEVKTKIRKCKIAQCRKLTVNDINEYREKIKNEIWAEIEEKTSRTLKERNEGKVKYLETDSEEAWKEICKVHSEIQKGELVDNVPEKKVVVEAFCYDCNEVVNHLIEYNKVLYTNGLEFYYLWKESYKQDGEINFYVKKIVDLTESWNKYKKCKENKQEIKQIISETEDIWNRLFEELGQLDWCKVPISNIREE